MRSPIPASPANVSAARADASPSRAISTSPRVISAAFALSPSPSPSTPPAASAITFFAAAQSSTPTMSGLTYTRKTAELIACWSWPARNPSSLAITAAVGRPSAISSAMFGPERTATDRPRTRVERRSPVAGSSPFVRLSTGASPGSDATTSANDGSAPRRRSRRRRAGTSSSVTASARRARSTLVQVAGVAARLRDRRAPARRVAGEHDVVAAVEQDARERRSPRARADDEEPHVRTSSRSRSTRARRRARSARAARSRPSKP